MLKRLKKFVAIATISLGVMGLSACGELVEVPNAHIGKIKTPSGYTPDLITPSKRRLDFCVSVCDELYVVSTETRTTKESFTGLAMPNDDNLIISADIRVTGNVTRDEDSIQRIFDNIAVDTIQISDIQVKGVSHANAYNNLVQAIIRSEGRDVLTQYTIDELFASREGVNAVLLERIRTSLTNRNIPYTVTNIQIGDISVPQVITDAATDVRQRNIELAQVQAENNKIMLALQAEYEQEKQKRLIEREKAVSVAEQNTILSDSVTPDYLAYRRLEVLAKLAESDNAVFVPFEALSLPGTSTRIFQEGK